MLDGIGSKEGVNFTECQITIQDVLANLTAVEELKCGFQLEEHICNNRETEGFLPNLKILNGIDASITEMEERNKLHDAIEVF